MGFIDKEQRIRQIQLAAEQTEESKATMLAEVMAKQQAIREQVEKEDTRHGPEDTAQIIDLLDHLPKFSIPSYLGLIKKYTGYESFLYLYTRDKRFTDEELRHRLWEFSVRPEGYSYRGERNPSEMFCGTGIKPKITHYGGFLNLIPTTQSISEPQEPGIGVCFEKKTEEKKIGSYARGHILHSTFDRFETTTQLVFARLLAPATVFVTGSGQRIPITSIKVLDNALEEGFKHTHVKKARWERETTYDHD